MSPSAHPLAAASGVIVGPVPVLVTIPKPSVPEINRLAVPRFEPMVTPTESFVMAIVFSAGLGTPF